MTFATVLVIVLSPHPDNLKTTTSFVWSIGCGCRNRTDLVEAYETSKTPCLTTRDITSFRTGRRQIFLGTLETIGGNRGNRTHSTRNEISFTDLHAFLNVLHSHVTALFSQTLVRSQVMGLV